MGNELSISVGFQRKEVSDFKILVAPDGSANLVLETADGLVELSIEHEMLLRAHHAFERVLLDIFRRKVMDHDRGRAVLETMIDLAKEPATIGVEIDRETGHRCIVYRFRDRLPYVVRLTDQQITNALDEISSEMKRISN